MRTMRKRDWLLLIAGVLVMTLALAAVMDANAQTPYHVCVYPEPQLPGQLAVDTLEINAVCDDEQNLHCTELPKNACPETQIQTVAGWYCNGNTNRWHKCAQFDPSWAITATAQYQSPNPLTRNDVAPACRTYPQPEGCPALPWYELSYFVPLERQQQIVQQAMPRVITMLGDIQGAGNSTHFTWPPIPDTYDTRGRHCFEVNDGGIAVEIPCASNLPAARRSIRRPVRRLRRSHR